MELNPYLSFQGNCKEAINFYKGILGGEFGMLADQFGIQWTVSTPINK